MQFKDLLFVLCSLTILGLLGFSVYKEETPEWAKYQRQFLQLQAKKVNDPKMASLALGIKQTWNQDLNRADRCTTCHMGIDKPSFADAPQPLKTHPNLEGYIKKHSFDKFGCTVCHDGEGRATTIERTHGVVEHLKRQPLSGSFTQASCTRCHLELYAPNVEFSETPELNLGKRLAMELGAEAATPSGNWGPPARSVLSSAPLEARPSSRSNSCTTSRTIISRVRIRCATGSSSISKTRKRSCPGTRPRSFLRPSCPITA